MLYQNFISECYIKMYIKILFQNLISNVISKYNIKML
jgi:hypothetical protein